MLDGTEVCLAGLPDVLVSQRHEDVCCRAFAASEEENLLLTTFQEGSIIFGIINVFFTQAELEKRLKLRGKQLIGYSGSALPVLDGDDVFAVLQLQLFHLLLHLPLSAGNVLYVKQGHIQLLLRADWTRNYVYAAAPKQLRPSVHRLLTTTGSQSGSQAVLEPLPPVNVFTNLL